MDTHVRGTYIQDLERAKIVNSGRFGSLDLKTCLKNKERQAYNLANFSAYVSLHMPKLFTKPNSISYFGPLVKTLVKVYD